MLPKCWLAPPCEVVFYTAGSAEHAPLVTVCSSSLQPEPREGRNGLGLSWLLAAGIPPSGGLPSLMSRALKLSRMSEDDDPCRIVIGMAAALALMPLAGW